MTKEELYRIYQAKHKDCTVTLPLGSTWRTNNSAMVSIAEWLPMIAFLIQQNILHRYILHKSKCLHVLALLHTCGILILFDWKWVVFPRTTRVVDAYSLGMLWRDSQILVYRSVNFGYTVDSLPTNIGLRYVPFSFKFSV